MGYIAGFDPGGNDGFGWALVENNASLPLNFVDAGVANHCDDAWLAITNQLNGNRIVGAGIDSPLYWGAETRNVDLSLRGEIGYLGSAVPHGTVQSPNSLRGACLVQGILVAKHVLNDFPDSQISECHPKVIIWQLGHANATRHHNSVPINDFREFGKIPKRPLLEHERDAVISTLSAWAMLNAPTGWSDLRDLDQQVYSPLGERIRYWMPDMRHNDA